MPKCTFIVTAYDRPAHLRCLLASLAIQTEQDFDIIVSDNHPDCINHSIVQEASYRGGNIAYLSQFPLFCYSASNSAAEHATGDYLCFPSDDNYYCPQFLSTMLAPCVSRGIDIVTCDMLYDPRYHGRYAVVQVNARGGDVDKGGFLIRRDLFLSHGGFPWQRTNGLTLADNFLMRDLTSKPGVKYEHTNAVLWVHN